MFSVTANVVKSVPKVAAAITNIGDRPRYDQIEPIAEQMMAAYTAGKFGRVLVSYMRFYSAGRQRPDDVVRVRTDLVTVPASVADSRGHRISGLTQSDFIVRDNGRSVTIKGSRSLDMHQERLDLGGRK